MLDKAELDKRAKYIVSECEGIQPIYVAFYVEAIFYAAGRARAAFSRFSDCTKNNAALHDTVASAHEALGHAAALSKFFFPPEKKPLHRARAAQLKQIFAVSNGSALQDRQLRNVLEHFDEYLDEYLLRDVVGYIFPGPMVNDASLADETIGHIFRLVDPKTEIFVLLGVKYPFGSMRREVERIAEMAEAMR